MANISPELGTAALNSDLCKSSVLFIKNRVLKGIGLTYSSALFRNVAWLSVCGAQKKITLRFSTILAFLEKVLCWMMFILQNTQLFFRIDF